MAWILYNKVDMTAASFSLRDPDASGWKVTPELGWVEVDRAVTDNPPHTEATDLELRAMPGAAVNGTEAAVGGRLWDFDKENDVWKRREQWIVDTQAKSIRPATEQEVADCPQNREAESQKVDKREAVDRLMGVRVIDRISQGLLEACHERMKAVETWLGDGMVGDPPSMLYEDFKQLVVDSVNGSTR